ncbi:ras gtpase-activating protein [Anaeramoeba flamelloides]|uniref:Ras gtpase-activating protein n=1 Tax=Anaeramoeba flamelloides TaxID=1746091 RepID=A0AAV8AE37_9EUKA|nr:ras gtpase-activating protein [Anaeramoeba flamelloides]
MTCLAKFDYISKHEGVLNFNAGDMLVLDKTDISNLKWVSGVNIRTGDEGIFPKHFAEHNPNPRNEIISPLFNIGVHQKSFKMNSVRLSKQVSKLINFNFDFNETNISTLNSQSEKERIQEKPKKDIEVKHLDSNYSLDNLDQIPTFPFYKESIISFLNDKGEWEMQLLIFRNHFLKFYQLTALNKGQSKDQNKNEREGDLCDLNNYQIGELVIQLDLFSMITIKKINIDNNYVNGFSNSNIELIFQNRRYFFKTKSELILEGWVLILELFFSFLYLFSDFSSDNSQNTLLIEILKYLKKLKIDFEKKIEYIGQLKLNNKNENENENENKNENESSNDKKNEKRKKWINKSMKGIDYFNNFLIYKMIQLKQQSGDNRAQMLITKDSFSHSETDLALKQYDLVSIVEAHQDEWWLGERKNKAGFFPPENGFLIVFNKKVEKQSNKNTFKFSNPKIINKRRMIRNQESFKKKKQNMEKAKEKEKGNEKDNEKDKKMGRGDIKEIISNWKDKCNILSITGLNYSGVLNKFDPKINDNWKQRYFIVNKNYLQYFQNKKSLIPKHTINLLEIEKLSKNSKIIQKPLNFSIYHPKKTLILSTEVERQYQQWINFLELILIIYQSEKKIKVSMIDNHKMLIEKIIDFLDLTIKNHLMKSKKINLNDNCNGNELIKFINSQIKIILLESIKKKYLSILARLQFPWINDKEIAYSKEEHKQILLKEELYFNSNEFFQLINEFDENYLQIDNGEEIGLALRSKLLIIDLIKKEELFEEITENINMNKNKKHNNQLINNNSNDKNKNKVMNKENNLKYNNKINNKDNSNKELKNPKTKSILNIKKGNRVRSGTQLFVRNLKNLVELEDKSGQSFPIQHEGYLKILKGNKYVRKYFKLKSWYLSYYDSKELTNSNSNDPCGAIDLRNLISFGIIPNKKKKREPIIKLKIKGGLTQNLKNIKNNLIGEWIKQIEFCLLFRELSKSVIIVNENDPNKMTKTIENNFLILIKYVEEIIEKLKIENNNQNNNKNSSSSSSSSSSSGGITSSIRNNSKRLTKKSIKVFLRRKKRQQQQQQKEKGQKQQEQQQQQQNEENEEIKKTIKFLSLCQTWRKKLLQKLARLKIKDQNDNRLRLYCLENYQSQNNSSSNNNNNKLSFNKGEWLILINRGFDNNQIKAQKIVYNQMKNTLDFQIGEVSLNYTEIIQPSFSNIFKRIKNNTQSNQKNNNLSTRNSNSGSGINNIDSSSSNSNNNVNNRNNNTNMNNNTNNDHGNYKLDNSNENELQLNTLNKIISKDSGNLQKVKRIEKLIHEDEYYLKKLKNNENYKKLKKKKKVMKNYQHNNLPLFIEGKILIEKKTGSDKWNERVLVIIDWYLIIFKKNSIKKILNLHNFITCEKCNDIIKHKWSLILYFKNEELRFAIDSKAKFEKWINVFTIIKTTNFLLIPFEKQNFNQNRLKYIKMIKWLEEEIQSESIKQINLFSGNKAMTKKNVLVEKQNKIKKRIQLFSKWREYLLSRMCRLYIIFQNTNGNDKNDKERIIQSHDDIRKRAFILQNYESKEGGYVFQENRFYLLINYNGSLWDVEVNKNDIKKIPSSRVETVIPETIKISIEFPSTPRKYAKKITEIKKTNKLLLKNKTIEKKNRQLKNYFNFEKNPLLFNKLFSKLFHHNYQEQLALFDLNLLNRKEAMTLSENLIIEWTKQIEMPLHFPVNCQNYIYTRYHGKGKLIRRWGVIRSWILKIYKSMDQGKPIKIIDLRTVIKYEKVIENNNKKFKIIFKFQNNLEEKIYFKNLTLLNIMYDNINAVKNFIYFLKPKKKKESDNDQIKIEILNRIYNWIKVSIFEIEKNITIQENLHNLYYNIEDSNSNNNNQNNNQNNNNKPDRKFSRVINNIQKKMNLLWLWRLRILSKICNIKFNKNENLSNINGFGFVHTTYNNEDNKINDENNKNENGNENGQKKENNNKYLNIIEGDWVLFENIPKLFNNNPNNINLNKININNKNLDIKGKKQEVGKEEEEEDIENDENLPMNLMGIHEKTNQRGLVNLNNISFITKNDILNELSFDFDLIKNSNNNNQISKKKYRKKRRKRKKNINKFETKFNNIPIFKEGWLLYYKSKSIVSSKWPKRWCVLKNYKLNIYANKDDLLPIVSEDLKSISSITGIVDEKKIPSYSSLPIKCQTNVFKIVTNERTLKFACEEHSIRFDWMTNFENIQKFFQILKPPSKIGYNARFRERLFNELKSWIESQIKYYHNEIKQMKSFFSLYKNKSDLHEKSSGNIKASTGQFENQGKGAIKHQDIIQLTKVEEIIEDFQKQILDLSNWRLQLLQKLLRFRLRDPKDYTAKAYMIKTITIEEQDLDLGEREWLNIIEELKTGGKTRVEKRGKMMLISNDNFIKVVPSPPEKFLEDMKFSKNSSYSFSFLNSDLNSDSESYSDSDLDSGSDTYSNGDSEESDEEDLEKEFLTNEKKIRLVELLVENQLTLTKSIVKSINIADADMLVQSLLVIFENKNLLMPLLEFIIEIEVVKTDSQGTLFRTNSVASKMTSGWAKAVGKDYLKSILGDNINEILSNKNKFGLDFRNLSESQFIQNKKNIEAIVKKTFKAISSSITECPIVIREIASKLLQITSKKFQQAKYTTLAGFMFLRFVSPAIVVPESIGIVKKNISRESRKGLVLVSKLIQNIANNTYLKDDTMSFLNHLIDDLHPEMTNFLDQLAEPVYIVKNIQNSKDFLILKNNNDNTFSGNMGRKINSQNINLPKSQLQLAVKRKNFFLERFQITEEQIDIAIEKIFKLLSIESFRNKVFDSLEENQDLIQQINYLFED